MKLQNSKCFRKAEYVFTKDAKITKQENPGYLQRIKTGLVTQ